MGGELADIPRAAILVTLTKAAGQWRSEIGPAANCVARVMGILMMLLIWAQVHMCVGARTCNGHRFGARIMDWIALLHYTDARH